MKILMVCMGNICRSPTAEAVLRQVLKARGLDREVEVDSAGTHGWHEGCAPDERAQHHARLRGYDLSGLRARRLVPLDFERFDLILVMDDENLADVHAICPPDRRHRVRRLMSYARRHRSGAVPDPYYGGAAGFEQVLDYVEDACEGLVDALTELRQGNAD